MFIHSINKTNKQEKKGFFLICFKLITLNEFAFLKCRLKRIVALKICNALKTVQRGVFSPIAIMNMKYLTGFSLSRKFSPPPSGGIFSLAVILCTTCWSIGEFIETGPTKSVQCATVKRLWLSNEKHTDRLWHCQISHQYYHCHYNSHKTKVTETVQ